MKSILVYLYLSIAILYVINSGVDLPGSLDDWLHANHEINYLLVGTIYFIIAIIYFNKDYKKEKEKIKEKIKKNKKCEKELKKMKNLSMLKKIVVFLIIVFLFYCWISMIKNILFKKSNKTSSHKLH